MFGFLNVWKPPGCTSRDVVDRVERLVRPVKAGHAGTLDPLATGVLVIALGPATRLVELLQEQSKTYEATFLFGCRSATDDTDSTVEQLPITTPPSECELLRVLPDFLGTIEQIPPSFSAVKVAGRRAYALARRGKEVQLPPRRVVVHDLQLRSYAWPEVRLHVHCGSGTYVRALGRDLAARFGTGAVMAALERTRVGPFTIADSISLTELSRGSVAARLAPARLAVEHLPALVIDDVEIDHFRCGRRIPAARAGAGDSLSDGDIRVALSATGDVIALVEVRQGELKPLRVFPPA
jgi:tRNA pseudouridine55 synthase